MEIQNFSKEMNLAAQNGDLEKMKWLYENYQWKDISEDEADEQEIEDWPLMNEYTFKCAAEHGNFDVMKWLRENGCPWDETALMYAVKRGNLDNMKWLCENGCPRDENAFSWAVVYGHLEIMKYLYTINCPLNKERACYYALCKCVPDFEVINWLRKHL